MLPMKKALLGFGIFLTLFLSSSHVPAAWAWRQGKIVSPEGETVQIEWTAAEKLKDAAKRDLGQNAQASYHAIRLRKAEPLHMHDSHDLTVVVLKGSGKIHFGYNAFKLEKGDITHIPRGIPHWVENTGKEPLEAYAIYMPPSDGKDFHRLDR